MKKIIFSTMIASLLAFVGCQNEELVSENTNNGGEKVILTANIQGAADSRVALTYDENDEDYPVKVDWRNSGEKEVFQVVWRSSNGFSAPTTFTQVEGSQFTGTIPSDITPPVFLATYGGTMDESGWDYNLSQQDGTLNEDFVLMEAKMVGATLPTTIDFEHITAILQPTFTGVEMDEIEQIVMSGVRNEISPINNATGQITIRPTDAQNGIYVFLTMPDDNNETYISNHTFNFTVTASDNVTAGRKVYTGSLTIPTGKSIEAGKFYTATIALTEVNYVWTRGIAPSASVEGNGTVGSPYLIHSANDLQWMIDQVNNAAPKPSAIDDDENSTLQLPYYLLTHDLEIDSGESATWTPIGTSSSPFVGYFDGGGHTISGEMVTASDVVDAGFFGYVGVGTVITNLTNAADITPLVQGGCQVGGIVGFAIGYDVKSSQYNSTYIIACHNTGTITYTNSETSEDFIVLGGIAGYIHGGTCVLACSNTGDMVINSSLSIKHGGIVGVGGTEINTKPSVLSCQTSKGTIIGGDFDVITRANYTTDENYKTDLYTNYISAYTEDIVWGVPNGLQDYKGLNFYIYAFNSMNYDYTGRTISCNWHWELVNGSVVLRAGKPT